MIPPKPERVKTLTQAEWAASPLAERALHVARSYVGERESAANDSKLIRFWLKLSGVLSPAPWCAAFVTACLVEAGADRKKLPRFAASTYYWWAWAKKNGRLREVGARGNVFVWNAKNGGHTGFVRQGGGVNPKFGSLEGNTNDEGSREGYEVCERERWTSEISRHPRWGYIVIDKELE